ncbi:MAG: hypothetical protein MUC59_06400 [Saprospiraceae bacterium]|nr:hypothetical protein [Saprospiraceae bacterium]
MFRNLKRLYIKVVALFWRFGHALAMLPLRFVRLMRHLVQGLKSLFQNKGRVSGHWWADFVLLLLDFLGVPALYETLMDFVKWNTRPLTPLERKLASSVFGEALRLDAICVDDRARVGSKKRNIVYVSFFTINAWGKIQPATFIHELVHVWQYQEMGAAYMSRALRAQRTKEGYNYGGVEQLREARQRGAQLTDFNLEQQADIVSDYFAIREGYRPVWGKGTKDDLPVYQYFMGQIRNDLVA